MYKVCKRIEVAGCHCLALPYDSKCTNRHGHNWIITVNIEGNELNPQGMLIDFTHIKKVVNQLDHADLNEVFCDKINPTAENIAEWVYAQVNAVVYDQWHESASIEARSKDPHASQEDIEQDALEILQFQSIPQVTLVSIQESEGNVACYIP
ncbi:MAG TPA: 6-carboxytetrahydropterin synthase [Anaerolineae bacterium]|nr:6-carboxytetrahydropterin synthase [Anaerolineae bacterium]